MLFEFKLPFQERPSSLIAARYFFRFVLGMLILGCIGVSSEQLFAQASQQPRFIEVEGTGTAEQEPDFIVLEGFVSATGETAIEVREKTESTRAKVEEDINPMDFPTVSVKYSSLSLTVDKNQNGVMMMVGGEAQVEEPGFKITQPIKFQLKTESGDSAASRVAAVTELMDVAKRVGIAFSDSNPNAIHYPQATADSIAFGIVENPKSLDKAATKKAFEDAKVQAEHLAELSGGSIGRVVSVRNAPISTEQAIYAAYLNQNDEERNLDVVTVTKRFVVRFELKQ